MPDIRPPDQNTLPLIEVRQLGKTYRSGSVEVHALRQIDLTIRQGDFVAIIGQSGSGKTTLLDILGCLSRPTSGSYHLEGHPVETLHDAALARVRQEQVGFIFQNFHLLPRKTAFMNVELPLQYAGVTARERRSRTLDLFAQVGLTDRLEHLPSQLSGGQQQRVAIARALANRPTLLLADEPTGSLDSKSGQDILTLLRHVNRTGTTIVLVTHSKELAETADRVITLRDGTIVGDEQIVRKWSKEFPSPSIGSGKRDSQS